MRLAKFLDATEKMLDRVDAMRRALVAESAGKNALDGMVARVVEAVDRKSGGKIRVLSKEDVWRRIRERPLEGFHKLAMEREHGKEAVAAMSDMDLAARTYAA